jgi:hypothetical protein
MTQSNFFEKAMMEKEEASVSCHHVPVYFIKRVETRSRTSVIAPHLKEQLNKIRDGVSTLYSISCSVVKQQRKNHGVKTLNCVVQN